MIEHTGQSRIWRPVLGALALCAALGLLLVAAPTARAASVEIHDNAHVLNSKRVQSEAAALPDPSRIFTTNSFTGSTDDFDQQTRDAVNDVDVLVINIDTVHRHLAIFGGTALPLTDDQYNDAIAAFRDAFHDGHYTGATIASIDSLRDSLQADSSGSGDTTGGTVPTSGDPGIDPTTGNPVIDPTTGFDLFPVFCGVGGLFVVGLGIITAFTSSASRRRRGPYDGPPHHGGFGDGWFGGAGGSSFHHGGSFHHSDFGGGSFGGGSFDGGNVGGGASGGFGGGNAGGGASGNF